MSRVRRLKNQTIKDDTTNKTFYNKGVSRKVGKKVGHKGNYTIMKFSSPYISIEKTGGGTSINPYVYKLDFSKQIADSIANHKADLLDKLEQAKGLNALYNNIESQRLKANKGFENMFSFNVDLKDSKLKITNIGNAVSKKISIRKGLPNKNLNGSKNNLYYVTGDFKLPTHTSIKTTLKIKSRYDVDSNNATPTEDGYKVIVNREVDNSTFSFYITYKNIPLTYDYLAIKLKEKTEEASIDFLIQYK